VVLPVVEPPPLPTVLEVVLDVVEPVVPVAPVFGATESSEEHEGKAARTPAPSKSAPMAAKGRSSIPKR